MNDEKKNFFVMEQFHLWSDIDEGYVILIK